MATTLKVNKKYFIQISIGVGLLFLISIYHTHVLKDFFLKWKQQSQVISQKKEQIKRAKSTLHERKSFESQFKDLSQKIQAQLPESREESQFLSEISNVANQNYVHIESLNPRPFKDLGDFKEMSVEIKMEANLGNMIRFLHQMRESSVLLEASRLRLQPKSERSALLKGHLVISTIFLKKNDT